MIITEIVGQARIIQLVPRRNMMRKILFMAGTLLLAHAAHAGQAGKVIFVAGNAKIATAPAALDAAVNVK
ncbi:MAG: hypothetical protein ACEQSK_13270 [Sphingomonadaceae bacterium]